MSTSTCSTHGSSSPVKSAKKKQDKNSLTQPLVTATKIKKCCRCNTDKPVTDFPYNGYFCIKCNRTIQRHSTDAVIKAMYESLAANTDLAFTRDQFTKVISSNDNFNISYLNWLHSNCNRKLKPVCKIIDKEKPLTLKNICITIKSHCNDDHSLFATPVVPKTKKTSRFNKIIHKVADSIMNILGMGKVL